jgi:hypothetical protein
VLVAAGAAQGFTFTPYVNFEGGYDDNVRFTRNPRADFFFSVRPGVKLSVGPPARQLYAAASVVYTHYFRLNELSRFEGGDAVARYIYEPSQNWRWEVWDRFTSSYDAAELDDEGRLVRVREDSGRRDSNTVGVSGAYSYDVKSAVRASQSHTYTTYTDQRGDYQSYRTDASWSHLFTPHWQGAIRAHWYRDIYEDEADQDRYGGGVTAYRLMGPTREAYLDLAYEKVTPLEEEDTVFARGQDYQKYSVTAGYSHRVTPRFRWSFAVGWAYVDGDTTFNTAADQGSPVASLQATYEGPTWRLGAFASTDLGEYAPLDENLGLARTHRVGAYYHHEFTQRLYLFLEATWLRSNYQVDPRDRTLGRAGDTTSVLAGADLMYRLTRWSRAGLRYRYLWRHDELDDQERRQNRILLLLMLQRPEKW